MAQLVAGAQQNEQMGHELCVEHRLHLRLRSGRDVRYEPRGLSVELPAPVLQQCRHEVQNAGVEETLSLRVASGRHFAENPQNRTLNGPSDVHSDYEVQIRVVLYSHS